MRRALPKASPALAKSVWQSQKLPSSRNVARALTAAGYRVDFTTIARWKRQGWPANSNADHPLDVARAKLDAITPLVTGTPIPAADDVDDKQEQLSDSALLRQESRKLSALSIQVWDAAEPQLKKLVRRRTGELALLVQALAETSQAVVDALSQAERMGSGPPLPQTT